MHYITDHHNHRVQVFSPQPGVVVGGTGVGAGGGTQPDFLQSTKKQES